jgi:hypothetical protein
MMVIPSNNGNPLVETTSHGKKERRDFVILQLNKK